MNGRQGHGTRRHPPERWPAIILSPDWNCEVERLLGLHPGALVVTADAAGNTPMGCSRRYLPVAAPLRTIAGMRRLRADRVVDLTPATRSTEYMRYRLASAVIRAPRLEHGGRETTHASACMAIAVDLGRRVLWRSLLPILQMSLLALWPVLELALLCRRRSTPAGSWTRLRRWRAPRTADPAIHRSWCGILLGYALACVRRRAQRDPLDRRIVIVMPDLLGDTVSCLPMIDAIRRQRPDARIFLACHSKIAPIVRQAAGLEAVIELDVAHPGQRYGGLASRGISALADLGFPEVLCPSFWPEHSGVLNRLRAPCIRVPDGSGFLVAGADYVPDNPRSWIYARRLGLLGAKPPDERTPLLPRRDPGRGAGPETRPPLIGIHTQAPMATRRLPAARILSALLDALAGRSARLAVFDRRDAFWTAAEREHGLHIEAWPGELPLADAVACLSTCDLLVAAEGGLGHIAGAMGTPSVLIYTSTSSADWLPWSSALPVEASPLACRPCYLSYCPTRLECHGGISHEALRSAIASRIPVRAVMGRTNPGATSPHMPQAGSEPTAPRP